MTDTLFDLPDSHSPRLEWMRRHGVKVEHHKHADMEPWMAYIGDRRHAIDTWLRENEEADDYYMDIDICCTGDTEDEVIVAIAKRNNLKLWNEE